MDRESDVASAKLQVRRWTWVAGIAIGSVLLVGTTVASAVTGTVTPAPITATNITALTFCKRTDGAMYFVASTTACKAGQTRYNLTGVPRPQGPAGYSAPHVVSSVAVGAGPDAVAVAFGSVWVVNQTPGTVSRIDATTHLVTAVVPVGSVPCGITSDGTNLWVANAASNTVSRIDPTTNSVGSIPAPARPQMVTWDGH